MTKPRSQFILTGARMFRLPMYTMHGQVAAQRIREDHALATD